MTSKTIATGVEISKIVYPVKAESGEDYEVSVDPVDGVTGCTCKAGSNGKDCKHQYAVRLIRSGGIGRPRIRGHQRPVRPTVRRVTVSEAMRDRLSQLDV